MTNKNGISQEAQKDPLKVFDKKLKALKSDNKGMRLKKVVLEWQQA